MSRHLQSDPDAPSFFGDWRIVEEHEFMSPTSAVLRAESDYSQALAPSDESGTIQKELREISSTFTSPKDEITGRLAEINRETSEQLDKARQKFLAIESTWKKNNLQRYLDSDHSLGLKQLSHVDHKLAQAVREVVEMKRDAEIALMELTKSVASVDSLISKTNRLKRSTCTFRQQANYEKKNSSMSLKMQVFIAAIATFAVYALLKYVGW
ncbi:putative integral membrane protein [Babesia bovis T2Bo]|uniref:putative integral membrane protein n=1 Tax=Babesia bovis T2Bo TaxID=484906 RepID=UPI001C361819|nr:putative integral membrane protein [Babesia bovis T2Bo]KAG6440065.1 putative integral membrane protein [Babesia bovis T2Bo]